jgi:hypothetical protein
MTTATKGNTMDINYLAKEIVAVNDMRLEGKIDRATHAEMIARLDRMVTGSGFTWDDVQAAAL